MPRTASGRILGWGTDWNAGDPEFYPMLKVRVTDTKYRSYSNAWLHETALARGCNAWALRVRERKSQTLNLKP